jgi:hypothetical protein
MKAGSKEQNYEYPRSRHERSGEEAPKPRGRPFEPGHSGNPSGRPKGSRNKATVLAEELLNGEMEELIRKLIEKARAGDVAALRLCLDRLLPPRHDRLVTFALPKIESAKDAGVASSAILAACAEGEVSLREARELLDIVGAHVRIVEATDFETRLVALEAKKTPRS